MKVGKRHIITHVAPWIGVRENKSGEDLLTQLCYFIVIVDITFSVIDR